MSRFVLFKRRFSLSALPKTTSFSIAEFYFHNDRSRINFCILKAFISRRIWHSEDRASWYVLIMKAIEMHYFSKLFDKVLYMLRTCPLSIIRSISTLYTRNRYLSCYFCWRLQADAKRNSMTNTCCVYTVLRYSWWWTVGMSETCRVLYQITLRNSASRWLSL